MPSLPLPQGKPLDVPRTMHQALELHHQGRIAEAEPLYAAVLAARPDHFDALQMLGVIKLARGELATALRLVVGGDAVAAEVAAGAVESRPRAQRHEPPRGGAGELRRGAQAQGPVRRGAQQSRQRAGHARTQRGGARQLQARHRHQARLCGGVLQPGQRASRSSTATTRRSRATTAPSRCAPNYAKAHCNRGVGAGHPRPAGRCARRATTARWRSQPDFAEAMLNRCGALRALQAHRRDAARPRPAAGGASGLCRGALHARHADGGLQPHRRGAGELREGGGAQARLQQGALGRRARRRCRSSTPRKREIATQRADYERRLRALRADYEAGRIPGDLSKGLGMAQPFFLAYQGHNDRELQSLFGGLATRIMADRYGAAELAPPPAPGEPVRVGIVSGFFYQHSVWKIGVKGWVTQLDPKRFQVSGYHTGTKQDAETALARQRCHRFVQGPHSTETLAADHPRRPAARPALPGNRHEPPRPSELAALRLAPAQCSYIGHPQTSGLPTIDYFLSGELIEPPDGAGPLFGKAGEAAQRRLPLRAAGASRRSAVTREELGLRPDATAYWCAQSLFKYLPQHDEVFPRIAREAGDCQFVFIRHFGTGRHRAVPAAARSRLRGRRPQGRRPLRVPATHGHEPLRRGERAMRPHARQHRLVGRQHHARGAGPGPAGRHLRRRADARPGQRRHPAHDGHARDDRRDASTTTWRSRSASARTPAWRAEIKTRIASDKHRLYRDRTCIAALEDFLDRAARPQALATRALPIARFNPTSRRCMRCAWRGARMVSVAFFSWLANAEKRQHAN